MPIIFPKGYRSPLVYPAGTAPGFDQSHIAAGQCIPPYGLSCIAAPGGAALNLLTGATASRNSIPSGDLTRIGPVIKFTSTQECFFSLVSKNQTNPLTFAAIFELDAITGGNVYQQIIGTDSGFGLYIKNTNFNFYVNADHLFGTPVVSIPYFIAASSMSASSSGVVVNMLTGSIITAQLGTLSPAVILETRYSIGNTATPFNQPLQGKIAAAMVSPVGLSLSQLTKWAEDPWLFWYPQPRRYWIGVSSATGISFDAASNSGYQTAQSIYTWNHTCAGTNRYLTVGISMLSVAGSSVTGITYNGVAMSLIDAKASISGAVRAELWGLVAPASGTNAISVTLSAALDSIGGAVSFSNVNQSISIEGAADASATNIGAADATVNVTTVADNDWCVDVVATDDTAITVGSGQTSRNNVTGILGSGAMSTEGPQTPPGAVTMSWTNVDALKTWSIVSVALRPLAASGAGGGFGALLAGRRFRMISGGLVLQ